MVARAGRTSGGAGGFSAASRYVRGGLGNTAAETIKNVGAVGVRLLPRQAGVHRYQPAVLRQSAKRWAADDLPRRSGACPHARVQHVINAVVRLSAHLRITRDDHGGRPDVLSRADVEGYLHLLAYLEPERRISRDHRIRICQDPEPGSAPPGGL